MPANGNYWSKMCINKGYINRSKYQTEKFKVDESHRSM